MKSAHELTSRMGFGCGGDQNEVAFRAGIRAIRLSPFDDGEGTPIHDFVSWTRIDSLAASEGEAIASAWRIRAERGDGTRVSAATIFGK
jgi:hypothetical protein